MYLHKRTTNKTHTKQKQKKKCNGYNKPIIFLIFYRKKDVTRAMQVKGKLPNLKSILKPELENNSSFLVILVRFCRSDRKCAEKLLSECSGYHEDIIRSSLIFSFWQSLRLLKELRKFIYVSTVKKQLYVFKLIILP